MGIRDRHKRAIARAAALRRDADVHGAIEVLAEVLTAEPQHTAANVEMARALRLLGDPSGAEEHIRLALGAVLDYQLVVELAGVLAEQGRVEEAEETIDAALFMAGGNPRLDPGEALLVRATIASAQGRVEDAEAALDQIEPKRASKQVKAFAERLRSELQA